MGAQGTHRHAMERSARDNTWAGRHGSVPAWDRKNRKRESGCPTVDPGLQGMVGARDLDAGM